MPLPADAAGNPSPQGAWRELSSHRARSRSHPLFVRVTHWTAAACIGALFFSGLVILVAHPRFYWGETGGLGGPSLFDLPMERLRLGAGWTRSLHFLAAWVIILTGGAYVAHGIATGHFGSRFGLAGNASRLRYPRRQRLGYLAVLFGLFPILIWTGFAMSPGLTAVFPFLVTLLGGQQSARTIHFLASVGLLLFVIGHVVMVARAGVRRLETMTGSAWPEDGRSLVPQPGRRRVLTAGVSMAAVAFPFGAVSLRRSGLIPPDAVGLLGVGDTITYATHRALLSSGPLARTFPPSAISTVTPINGNPPQTATYLRQLAGEFAEWRLSVDGLVARPGTFTLDELKRMAPTTQITHLACEEGWSYIAEWTGVSLASVLSRVGISPRARYVAFFAFDRSWNSLDIADAMHPQTLLAYAMNGRDLPPGHGAPLRLHIPRQLGYKQTKYLLHITVADRLETIRNGLGALSPESGYSWYAGI